MSSAGVAVSAEHDSSNLQPYTFYPEGGEGALLLKIYQRYFYKGVSKGGIWGKGLSVEKILAKRNKSDKSYYRH